MVKENCWSCKRMKGDVKLRACDDRLCRTCYKKNDEALLKLRVGDNTGVTGCVAAGADGTSDCHSCRNAITGVSGVLKCDICVQILHPGCVGVSEAVLAVFLPIIDATRWVCPGCRTQSRQQLLSLQASGEHVIVLNCLVFEKIAFLHFGVKIQDGMPYFRHLGF